MQIRVRRAMGNEDTRGRQPAPGLARRARTAAGLLALAATLSLPGTAFATEHETPPTTFEAQLESENFAITEQRQTIYDTPEYQAELAEQGKKNHEEATTEQAEDPERVFSADLCYEGENGCAGA